MISTGQWIRASIELPPPYEEVLGCIGDEEGFAYMLGWYDPQTFREPSFENGLGPGVWMKDLLFWMRIPTPQGLDKKTLESQAPKWKAQEQEEEQP